MDRIKHPAANDILSGRGPVIYNHEGNRQFRKLVENNTDLYRMLPDRALKSNLVEKILTELRSNGCRFLKKDRATGLWSDIGSKGARDKVAHSLRDFSDQQKKQQQSPLAIATTKQNQRFEGMIVPCQQQHDESKSIFSMVLHNINNIEETSNTSNTTRTMGIYNEDEGEESSAIGLSHICHEVLSLLDNDDADCCDKTFDVLCNAHFDNVHCNDDVDCDDIDSVQSLDVSSFESVLEGDSKAEDCSDDFTPLEFAPLSPCVTPKPSTATDALVIDGSWLTMLGGFIPTANT